MVLPSGFQVRRIAACVRGLRSLLCATSLGDSCSVTRVSALVHSAPGRHCVSERRRPVVQGAVVEGPTGEPPATETFKEISHWPTCFPLPHPPPAWELWWPGAQL